MTRNTNRDVSSPKENLRFYIIIVLLNVFGTLGMGCNNREGSSGEPNPFTISPGKSVGDVRLGMTIDEVSHSLGLYDKREERFLYYSEFGLIVTLQDERVRSIICYYESHEYGSFTGATNSGIGPNSSVADVVAEYGPPTDQMSSVLPEIYEHAGREEHELIYSSKGVLFNFVDGKLYYIQVFPIGAMSDPQE